MKHFGIPSPLFAPEDDGAAGGGTPGDAEIRRLVNEEINRALTGYMKREFPKLMKTQMQQGIAELQPQLAEAFLERLAEELPSDEEIDQMESQELQEMADANGMTVEELQQALAEQQGLQPGQPTGELRPDPRMNGELLALKQANQRLQAQMEEIVHAREEAEHRAEETDRLSSVNGWLSKYPWKDDFSRGLAFNYVKDLAKRVEDGTIAIQDLPGDKWIEDNINQFSGLLQSKNVAGAGAFSPNFGGKHKAPDTDQIRSGMPAEEREQVRQAALAALQGSGQV
jgi:hypothetical protein